MGAFWSLATSTTVFADLPPWTSPEIVAAVWKNPDLLAQGLAFSIPLLIILGAHELGHYWVARHYGLRVSPPYFLPLPAALGTLGAFIRLRSPVRNRRELFDVGISGPLAGFLALIPFLVLGVALSQPVELSNPPAPASTGLWEIYQPGESLALLATVSFLHEPLPAGWILELHPMALAAWVGLLATALNLLPLAQLDGGHILYAVVGRRQRQLALPTWCLLLLAGWWWPGWYFWAFVVLVLGLVHPPVRNESIRLDAKRYLMALVALLLLVVCFMPVPLKVATVG